MTYQARWLEGFKNGSKDHHVNIKLECWIGYACESKSKIQYRSMLYLHDFLLSPIDKAGGMINNKLWTIGRLFSERTNTFIFQ